MKIQTERPDVISFIEKGVLTEEEIVSNSTLLIVAGCEQWHGNFQVARNPILVGEITGKSSPQVVVASASLLPYV